MATQEQITFLQFQNIFSNEEICREHIREHIFKIRRAKGFKCPQQ
jgi:hypothetical protein